MAQQYTIGLEFPIGFSLDYYQCFISDGHRLLFWHKGEDQAYMLTATHDELMGKHVFKAKSASEKIGVYALSYEFEDADLLAARLTTQFNRARGMQMDEAQLLAFNVAVEQGDIKIISVPQDPHIIFAADLQDGRRVVFADYYNDKGFQRDLFMGEPGNLEMVEMENYLQGGNTFHITLKNGDKISYDSIGQRGLGVQMGVIFNNEIATPFKNYNPRDLSTLGVNLPPSNVHYDPFTHPKAPKL